MLTLLLVIILIACIGGVGPWWGYSSGWGYGPSGIVGLVLVIILVLFLFGHRLSF